MLLNTDLSTDGIPGMFKDTIMRPLLGCLALLAISLAVGCETSQPQRVIGSEWRPVLLGDQAVAADTQAFVGFRGDGSLVGNGGCNAFHSIYGEADGTLEIGVIAATRMMCPDPAMETERALLAALENAAIAEREGTRLTLRDADGTELGRFVQTDWD
ncbi:MAG: META domain-containing protein, partial [Rhodospirillaceae bacterium]|nr:META domain-containing protein [Rhodospirillaceae bacterium]